MSCLHMDVIDIKETDTFDVLGTRIRTDVLGTRYIIKVSKEEFKCLGFVNRCKRYNLYQAEDGIQFNIRSAPSSSCMRLLNRVSRMALKHRRNVSCVII